MKMHHREVARKFEKSDCLFPYFLFILSLSQSLSTPPLPLSNFLPILFSHLYTLTKPFFQLCTANGWAGYSTSATILSNQTAVLLNYPTNTELSATLASYATQNFVQNTLSNTLNSYTTNSALASTLSSYVTGTSLSSRLSSYVTSSSLSSTLSSYTSNTELTATLGSYVTHTALTSTLSSYATTTAINGLLSSYATSADVSSNYVSNTNFHGTVNALSQNITSVGVVASSTQSLLTNMHGVKVAQYRADFDHPPKSGWAYMWNGLGSPIGVQKNYINLVWSRKLDGIFEKKKRKEQ